VTEFQGPVWPSLSPFGLRTSQLTHSTIWIYFEVHQNSPKLKKSTLHDLILFQGRTGRHEATEAEVRTMQTLVDYLNIRKKNAALLNLEVDICSSYLDTVFPVDEDSDELMITFPLVLRESKKN
jgi:hypothetical protein